MTSTPDIPALTATQRDHLRDLGEPCVITHPRRPAIPLIVSSPHSGRVYTPAFQQSAILRDLALRKSEDAFVDELFAQAPDYGATLLAARFPRAYLDVNRERSELDPALIDGLPTHIASHSSPRVVAGLGVIPRIVADGENIYAQRMSNQEAEFRLTTCYDPYHAALKALIDTSVSRFGHVILIDCHSMPSNASGQTATRRPHVVIGDRYGTAANPDVSSAVGSTFTKLGLDVLFNRPYAGGFITEHYGQPASGIHVVQIEINRALYLDEANVRRSPGFTALQTTISAFLSQMARDVHHLLPRYPAPPLAAE